MAAMETLFLPEAPLLFDDFIERTFLYDADRRPPITHSKPWIGIFHHPPDMPDWYGGSRLDDLLLLNNWRDSEPYLKLAICLAPNTADWVQSKLAVPVEVLRHPTDPVCETWSAERFLRNPKKKLLQIGSFLRNTYGIYQTEAPTEFTKTRLVQSAGWVAENHRRCQELYGDGRGQVGNVDEILNVDNATYDNLLTENVVFLDLIAAAANNTVVECIARATPIAVNRADGPVYYLGRDYPLFHDDLVDIPKLLDVERVFAAHQYLLELDREWLSGARFAEDIVAACRRTRLVATSGGV